MLSNSIYIGALTLLHSGTCKNSTIENTDILISHVTYSFFKIQCAESALKSVLGDLSNTYFVGNAPMAHMVVPPKEEQSGSAPFKVYYKEI